MRSLLFIWALVILSSTVLGQTPAEKSQERSKVQPPNPAAPNPKPPNPKAPNPKVKVSARITLLVWNVAKQVAVREELADYAEQCDIVCLQEYVPGLIDEDLGHAEFAPSYQSWFSGIATGVCTVSKHPHTGADALRSPWREGFFLTPKMTLISTHVLGETQLMVVNLHGMNFQPYMTFMLRQQLQEVATRVERHMGPVIVCGDFNTWSHPRQRLVESTLSDCRRVEFPEHPQRKTGEWIVSLVGGDPTLPLDHVYTRGVEVVAKPKILATKHSDHAPLQVTLKVTNP